MKEQNHSFWDFSYVGKEAWPQSRLKEFCGCFFFFYPQGINVVFQAEGKKPLTIERTLSWFISFIVNTIILFLLSKSDTSAFTKLC